MLGGALALFKLEVCNKRIIPTPPAKLSQKLPVHFSGSKAIPSHNRAQLCMKQMKVIRWLFSCILVEI